MRPGYDIIAETWQAAAADSSGLVYAYAMNDRQSVTNETVISDADSQTLIREHDGFLRRVSLDACGLSVRYGHDSENRMSTASNDVFSVPYAYTLDGLDAGYTIILTNGTAVSRHVVRDAHRPGLIETVTNTVNDTPLNPLGYGYDVLSRATNRNDDTFTYHARSELTDATVSGSVYGYAYDSIGNHVWSAENAVTNTYAANNLNQYANITPPLAVAYDSDGNMTRYGVCFYSWDGENRLRMAQPVGATNGSVRVGNAYDYMSRRVRKTLETLSGQTPPSGSPPMPGDPGEWSPVRSIRYVWDGWNLVAEIAVDESEGTTNVTRYVWGKDLSGTMQGAGGVGGLLAAQLDGLWCFPLYDANGNITDYVNESGTVVAHREYGPFGRTTVATGPLVHALHFWFSTKYLDEETGLYYYGERFYSPDLMRWLNRDPIGEQGGMNLYGFVGNDPVNVIDYRGLHNIQFDEGKVEYVDNPLSGLGWASGTTDFVGGNPTHAPKCKCENKKWRIDLTWVMKLRTRIAGMNAKHPESGKSRTKEGVAKTERHEAYHRANLKKLFNEVLDSYNLSASWSDWLSCQRVLTPLSEENKSKIDARIRDERNHTGALWGAWFKENGKEGVW